MTKPFHQSWIRWFALAVGSLTLYGCKEIDCGRYRHFLKNADDRVSLQQWADSEIFTRSFTSSELRTNCLRGPLPSPGCLKRDLAQSLLPDGLKHHYVRLIGMNADRPDMILIGLRKFQGLLVSRGSFDSALAQTRFTKDRLEGVEGRVGLLCLIPFD
ncbi:MAG: hypothetical protein R3F22_05425 [Lysobacteraceae bacterium]